MLTLIAALLTLFPARADLPWTTIPTPQFPKPEPYFPHEARVPGYDPALHAVWFDNYSLWDGSSLPEFAQVPHCTGLALLSRQLFIHAKFDPSREAPSPQEMERLLKRVYERHSGYLPGEIERVEIPGYADLGELSEDPDMEPAIRNTLGDALGDALRPDWNWTPVHEIGWRAEDGRKAERRIRSQIAHGLPVIIYLTDGLETAHAVLAYAYRTTETGVVYEVYDPASPGGPTVLPYSFATGTMADDFYGERHPFVLFPYRYEP